MAVFPLEEPPSSCGSAALALCLYACEMLLSPGCCAQRCQGSSVGPLPTVRVLRSRCSAIARNSLASSAYALFT
jgi:hypothetical protein